MRRFNFQDWIGFNMTFNYWRYLNTTCYFLWKLYYFIVNYSTFFLQFIQVIRSLKKSCFYHCQMSPLYSSPLTLLVYDNVVLFVNARWSPFFKLPVRFRCLAISIWKPNQARLHFLLSCKQWNPYLRNINPVLTPPQWKCYNIIP